jgi:bifunctional non-homologous end joining protein LigD
MSDARFVPPMLATRVRKLPEELRWEYELKLDGYRLQAIKNRGGNDYTRKFAKIATAVSTIKAASALLDGEGVVVCISVSGTPLQWLK